MGGGIVTWHELMLSALSLSVCDLLAKERFKFHTLVKVLEQKGIVSENELLEALQASVPNPALPPPSFEEDLGALRAEIVERMTVRAAEMRNPERPISPN